MNFQLSTTPSIIYIACCAIVLMLHNIGLNVINNKNEIMKLTEVKDLVAQEAGYADWLNIENSDLENHEITEIQANLLNRVAELYAEKTAIVFADYVENLKPTQKVSVWSKNGEHKGLFIMDNEQLFKKYKTSKAK